MREPDTCEELRAKWEEETKMKNPADEASKQEVECRCCENGRWWTECCNGSGGCSCQGGPIDMGECLVCKGTGFHDPETPTDQNWKSIAGLCFIGSGPETGMWSGPEIKKGNLV